MFAGKGNATTIFSRTPLNNLSHMFVSRNFFDLPESYDNRPCLAVDGSGALFAFGWMPGRSPSEPVNAPPLVGQLMDEVAAAARVWRWVLLIPAELRNKIARGWRISEDMPKIMQD